MTQPDSRWKYELVNNVKRAAGQDRSTGSSNKAKSLVWDDSAISDGMCVSRDEKGDKGIDELRLYGYLSRDLAFRVWNDLAIPVDPRRLRRITTDETEALTQILRVPQQGSGASRMERSCHSYRNRRSSERNEEKQNRTER